MTTPIKDRSNVAFEELYEQGDNATQSNTNGRISANDQTQVSDIDNVRQALSRLAAWRCDEYNSWIAVGLALKQSLGDSGYDLWVKWSKQNSEFDVDVCNEKWQTFKPRKNQAITIRTIFQWAKDDTLLKQSEGRVPINVQHLDLIKLRSTVWQAIHKANKPPTLFQCGTDLVRLSYDDETNPKLEPITKAIFRSRIAEACYCYIVSGRDKRIMSTTPPDVLVEDTLINPDYKLPTIRRIVRTPVFTNDGELITKPGYHANAKLYYEPANFHIPIVSEKPTTKDVAEAKRLLLDELLIDFPFVTDADRAHAIALALLPYVRGMIDGPTPMHGIEAPAAGTGKGLLFDALLMSSNSGNQIASTTEAGNDAEWGKTLLSILMKSPTYVVIDNITKPLTNGHLASALTQPRFSGRVLGFSETAEVPISCVWVCTGNNIALGGDIPRRYLRIRIDAQVAKPEERQCFKHNDLRKWLKENCGQIVWAMLTIIRSGLQGPNYAGKIIGSYEAYCNVIGRILQNVGISGFLGNRNAVYEAVSENTLWSTLIGRWWEHFEDKQQPVNEILKLAEQCNLDLGIEGTSSNGRGKSLGRLLTARKDMVFSVRPGSDDTPQQDALSGDFKLEKKDTNAGARWYLKQIV